jgi:hypothetical protein
VTRSTRRGSTPSRASSTPSGIYLDEEVARFCDVYFKPKQKQSALDHQAMNAALDPAVSRFKARSEESPDEAELWRGKLQAFQNLYGFLSQVIPYQDSDLERLYVFVRHLMTKLPRRASGAAYQFDDEVKLEYYRLQKISEGSIALKDGEARKLDGPGEVGKRLCCASSRCRSRSSSTSSTSDSGPTSTRPISCSSTRSSRRRWRTEISERRPGPTLPTSSSYCSEAS